MLVSSSQSLEGLEGEEGAQADQCLFESWLASSVNESRVHAFLPMAAAFTESNSHTLFLCPAYYLVRSHMAALSGHHGRTTWRGAPTGYEEAH